jgi:hypothetical protein
MKTATIPALRVEPQLREAVQNVLSEGETLSSFVEEALRSNLERRLHLQTFIARGMTSREQALKNQKYYSAESVLAELSDMLKKA